jgi:hypothetical protein
VSGVDGGGAEPAVLQPHRAVSGTRSKPPRIRKATRANPRPRLRVEKMGAPVPRLQRSLSDAPRGRFVYVRTGNADAPRNDSVDGQARADDKRCVHARLITG